MSTLRILVPVKRVIDYAIKPRVNPAKTAVVKTGVKHSLNPFDEISVEEAVKIRERNVKSPSSSTPNVDEIIAFSIGPPRSVETLRTAMAMGADRSIFIEVNDDEEPESLGVAKLLAKIVQKEKINLVIAGKQSIDSDAGSVGGMLSGLLGWGFAGQACNITFQKPNFCVIEKEVDGGTETVRGSLPMVITTDLRLNEPRYATLSNLMKAKRKIIDKLTPEELGVDISRRLLTREVTEPLPRQGGGKVEDVDSMIQRLKELHAI
ncbi:putative beta-subunit electron transfer flavoprotein [Erysiphe necator]|uniref:Probable electron transfer flavoprotein subunit beta n=1 Tax=Uncinula necator TaxID=52586 RepID=A0A0B1P567_UNCNE|nr:putative beta-subunit electron transfer flavoprotein [Erysiphe necator]